VTRTPRSRSKGQRSRSLGRFTHAVLTRQTAAAVSVGTYWPWETTATLRSARRRFGAHRGRRRRGHIVAAARLWVLKHFALASGFFSSGFWFFSPFLQRDAMRKRGRCCRSVSVCPSVCPSRSCIISRWLKVSSNFFLGPVAGSF